MEEMNDREKLQENLSFKVVYIVNLCQENLTSLLELKYELMRRKI